MQSEILQSIPSRKNDGGSSDQIETEDYDHLGWIKSSGERLTLVLEGS